MRKTTDRLFHTLLTATGISYALYFYLRLNTWRRTRHIPDKRTTDGY